jgi:magnesium chelatase family protein
VNTRFFFEESQNNKNYLDFSEIKGQSTLRRAVEIAVDGGHDILMIGPPGAGKSMIAKYLFGSGVTHGRSKGLF